MGVTLYNLEQISDKAERLVFINRTALKFSQVTHNMNRNILINVFSKDTYVYFAHLLSASAILSLLSFFCIQKNKNYK